MRPSIIRFLIILPLGLVLSLQGLIWAKPGVAQSGPVALIRDDNGISGFDLYQNTLYYWRNIVCLGPAPEFSSQQTPVSEYDTIATTGPLGVAPLFTVKTEDCSYLSDDARVVRDGMFVYFAYGPGNSLHRKTVSSLPAQPPTPLCAAADALACAGVSPSSLFADDGYLYWSRFHEQEKKNTIMRAPLDGSAPPEVVLIALGQTAPIYRLERVTYTVDGREVAVFLGLTRPPGSALTPASTLYRYQALGQTSGLAVKVGDNIEDFAVHRTWSFGGCCQVRAYLAKGRWYLPVGLTPSQNESALLRYHIVSGELEPVYRPNGLEQILRVTTDSDLLIPFGNTERRIYIGEYATICPDESPSFCIADSPAIRRNVLPAGETGWETIVVSLPGVGSATRDGYLRSDDLWLYLRYARGPGPHNIEIAKISTDAPPVALDVAAVGLEVVQTIQTLAIDIPLIAWKPTYAKGYATLAANTTGKATWPVTAELRGFLNGNELPGSPLSPINNAILDDTSDLEQLRAANDDRGVYLFELPDSWVQKGQLSLVMVVDPKGTVPETGSLTNNSVSLKKPATVIERGFTCLDTARIWSNPMIPSSGGNGLLSIVERARSLLPVFDFHIFHSGERIENRVAKPEVECGLYPWGYVCPVVIKLVDEPFVFTGGSGPFHHAMFWMTWEEAFGHIDSDCAVADDHLLGMVHPGAVPPGVAGTAPNWPNNLIVSMDPTPLASGQPWNVPTGGRTVAHELGHNYGRSHINQNNSSTNCGGSTPEDPSAYPYDGCAFGRAENGQGLFGFDVVSRRSIHPATAADLMSYASATWISDFTYNAIAADIDKDMVTAQQSVGGPVGPTMLVSGIITPTAGRADFLGVYNLPAGVAPPDRMALAQFANQEAQQAGERSYTLKLLDAADQELASAIIVPWHGGELPRDHDFFLHYVRDQPETARLVLLDGATVLAERVASRHAPVLTLEQPIFDEATNTLQLAWNAYDEDNRGLDRFTDTIIYTALYSADNGQTWKAVESNFTTRALVLDANWLPGSTAARLRIIAGDGFHATVATTEAFALPDRAPVPLIEGLSEGQRLHVGQTVQVYGLALDADQGSLPREQLSWQLSGPREETFSGIPLLLTLFDPGAYHLQLSAADDKGHVSEASVNFEVLPLAIGDVDEPTLDGLCNDEAYAAIEPLPLKTAAGDVRLWMVHAANALFVCFADMQRALLFNTPPNVAELRVDIDASGGAATGVGDIGFQVNQNSVPRMLIGGATPMLEDTAPPTGYTVVVNHVGESWSAELRIAESLLGGWNHSVRMMAQIGSPTQIGGIEARWPLAATAEGPSSWASVYLGQPAPPPNQAPVAAAGVDQAVHVVNQMPVSLDGGKSHDPDRNRLSYQWAQISGPRVTLENAQTAYPYFTTEPPPAVTKLVFHLTVADEGLESEADEVVVTLIPSPQAAPLPFRSNTFLPLVVR